MLQDAYTKLDTLEVEDLLQGINPRLKDRKFNPETTTILAAALPFYPEYRFLDIADHSTLPPKKTQILYGRDEVTILDWTNAPIYKINKKAPIYLDDQTVQDYVRFFFSFVRGRHGRFLITESIEDIAWKEEPPPAARKAISSLLEPARLIGMDDDGAFLLSVRTLFKDSLFRSKVRVTPDGVVSISDQELVVEDMPVLDDALGQ